jgi:hypothetical protein
MEQLTLEQAAANHSRRACVTHVELNRTAQEIDNIAFQAGAEWQKEQYKHLLQIGRLLVDMCDNKLGVTFTSTQFRNALELIQDCGKILH